LREFGRSRICANLSEFAAKHHSPVILPPVWSTYKCRGSLPRVKTSVQPVLIK
jgi:hypothetical protein